MDIIFYHHSITAYQYIGFLSYTLFLVCLASERLNISRETIKTEILALETHNPICNYNENKGRSVARCIFQMVLVTFLSLGSKLKIQPSNPRVTFSQLHNYLLHSLTAQLLTHAGHGYCCNVGRERTLVVLKDFKIIFSHSHEERNTLGHVSSIPFSSHIFL